MYKGIVKNIVLLIGIIFPLWSYSALLAPKFLSAKKWDAIIMQTAVLAYVQRTETVASLRLKGCPDSKIQAMGFTLSNPLPATWVDFLTFITDTDTKTLYEGALQESARALGFPEIGGGAGGENDVVTWFEDNLRNQLQALDNVDVDAELKKFEEVILNLRKEHDVQAAARSYPYQLTDEEKYALAFQIKNNRKTLEKALAEIIGSYPLEGFDDQGIFVANQMIEQPDLTRDVAFEAVKKQRFQEKIENTFTNRLTLDQKGRMVEFMTEGTSLGDSLVRVLGGDYVVDEYNYATAIADFMINKYHLCPIAFKKARLDHLLTSLDQSHKQYHQEIRSHGSIALIEDPSLITQENVRIALDAILRSKGLIPYPESWVNFQKDLAEMSRQQLYQDISGAGQQMGFGAIAPGQSPSQWFKENLDDMFQNHPAIKDCGNKEAKRLEFNQLITNLEIEESILLKMQGYSFALDDEHKYKIAEKEVERRLTTSQAMAEVMGNDRFDFNGSRTLAVAEYMILHPELDPTSAFEAVKIQIIRQDIDARLGTRIDDFKKGLMIQAIIGGVNLEDALTRVIEDECRIGEHVHALTVAKGLIRYTDRSLSDLLRMTHIEHLAQSIDFNILGVEDIEGLKNDVISLVNGRDDVRTEDINITHLNGALKGRLRDLGLVFYSPEWADFQRALSSIDRCDVLYEQIQNLSIARGFREYRHNRSLSSWFEEELNNQFEVNEDIKGFKDAERPKFNAIIQSLKNEELIREQILTYQGYQLTPEQKRGVAEHEVLRRLPLKEAMAGVIPQFIFGRFGNKTLDVAEQMISGFPYLDAVKAVKRKSYRDDLQTHYGARMREINIYYGEDIFTQEIEKTIEADIQETGYIFKSVLKTVFQGLEEYFYDNLEQQLKSEGSLRQIYLRVRLDAKKDELCQGIPERFKEVAYQAMLQENLLLPIIEKITKEDMEEMLGAFYPGYASSYAIASFIKDISQFQGVTPQALERLGGITFDVGQKWPEIESIIIENLLRASYPEVFSFISQPTQKAIINSVLSDIFETHNLLGSLIKGLKRMKLTITLQGLDRIMTLPEISQSIRKILEDKFLSDCEENKAKKSREIISWRDIQAAERKKKEAERKRELDGLTEEQLAEYKDDSADQKGIMIKRLADKVIDDLKMDGFRNADLQSSIHRVLVKEKTEQDKFTYVKKQKENFARLALPDFSDPRLQEIIAKNMYESRAFLGTEDDIYLRQYAIAKYFAEREGQSFDKLSVRKLFINIASRMLEKADGEYQQFFYHRDQIEQAIAKKLGDLDSFYVNNFSPDVDYTAMDPWEENLHKKRIAEKEKNRLLFNPFMKGGIYQLRFNDPTLELNDTKKELAHYMALENLDFHVNPRTDEEWERNRQTLMKAFELMEYHKKADSGTINEMFTRGSLLRVDGNDAFLEDPSTAKGVQQYLGMPLKYKIIRSFVQSRSKKIAQRLFSQEALEKYENYEGVVLKFNQEVETINIENKTALIQNIKGFFGPSKNHYLSLEDIIQLFSTIFGSAYKFKVEDLDDNYRELLGDLVLLRFLQFSQIGNQLAVLDKDLPDNINKDEKNAFLFLRSFAQYSVQKNKAIKSILDDLRKDKEEKKALYSSYGVKEEDLDTLVAQAFHGGSQFRGISDRLVLQNYFYDSIQYYDEEGDLLESHRNVLNNMLHYNISHVKSKMFDRISTYSNANGLGLKADDILWLTKEGDIVGRGVTFAQICASIQAYLMEKLPIYLVSKRSVPDLLANQIVERSVNGGGNFYSVQMDEISKASQEWLATKLDVAVGTDDLLTLGKQLVRLNIERNASLMLSDESLAGVDLNVLYRNVEILVAHKGRIQSFMQDSNLEGDRDYPKEEQAESMIFDWIKDGKDIRAINENDVKEEQLIRWFKESGILKHVRDNHIGLQKFAKKVLVMGYEEFLRGSSETWVPLYQQANRMLPEQVQNYERIYWNQTKTTFSANKDKIDKEIAGLKHTVSYENSFGGRVDSSYHPKARRYYDALERLIDSKRPHIDEKGWSVDWDLLKSDPHISYSQTVMPIEDTQIDEAFSVLMRNISDTGELGAIVKMMKTLHHDPHVRCSFHTALVTMNNFVASRKMDTVVNAIAAAGGVTGGCSNRHLLAVNNITSVLGMGRLSSFEQKIAYLLRSWRMDLIDRVVVNLSPRLGDGTVAEQQNFLKISSKLSLGLDFPSESQDYLTCVVVNRLGFEPADHPKHLNWGFKSIMEKVIASITPMEMIKQIQSVIEPKADRGGFAISKDELNKFAQESPFLWEYVLDEKSLWNENMEGLVKADVVATILFQLGYLTRPMTVHKGPGAEIAPVVPGVAGAYVPAGGAGGDNPMGVLIGARRDTAEKGLSMPFFEERQKPECWPIMRRGTVRGAGERIIVGMD